LGWQLRFRRVWRSGPVRWTLSKHGVGWSWGFRGFRYGVSPNGQRYICVGIPGTGSYWIKYVGKPGDRSEVKLTGPLPEGGASKALEQF